MKCAGGRKRLYALPAMHVLHAPQHPALCSQDVLTIANFQRQLKILLHLFIILE